MRFITFRYFLLFFSLLILNTQAFAKYAFHATAFNDISCSNARLIAYGPFDYKTAPHDKIQIVLDYHFTPERYYSENDINYTLGALPNYHPALLNMVKVYLYRASKHRRKQRLSKTKLRPPECYLYRALRFRPKDHQTHNLFAYFLYKIKKYDEAIEYYKKSIKIKKKNAEAYYHLGLILVTLDRFEEARKYAKIAYKQKYPLKGLKRQLKKAGYPL